MKLKFVFLLMLTAVGCTDNRGFVQIHGVVRYDGVAVPTGVITFYPERGRPASAKLDRSGNYELSSYKAGDGVSPGAYRVVIKAVREPSDATSGEQDAFAVAHEVRWIVPQEYSDLETTPLKVTVTPDGERIINFDIPKG